MTDVGPKAIGSGIQVVRAESDEQNRVVVDPKKVYDASHQPVDIGARRKLINDYLTEPDQCLLDTIDSTFG